MNISLTNLCTYLKLNPQYLKLLSERDTSDVWRQFAVWLLVNPKDGFIRFTDPGSDQHDVITYVAQLYTEDCKDLQTWKIAVDAAYAATLNAITRAAAHAAAATRTIALAVYEDADASLAAYAAARSASLAAYAAAAKYKMRNKLIKLINAAPPKETT